MFTVVGLLSLIASVLIILIDGYQNTTISIIEKTPLFFPINSSLNFLGTATFCYTIHYCVLAIGAEGLICVKKENILYNTEIGIKKNTRNLKKINFLNYFNLSFLSLYHSVENIDHVEDIDSIDNDERNDSNCIEKKSNNKTNYIKDKKSSYFKNIKDERVEAMNHQINDIVSNNIDDDIDISHFEKETIIINENNGKKHENTELNNENIKCSIVKGRDKINSIDDENIELGSKRSTRNSFETDYNSNNCDNDSNNDIKNVIIDANNNNSNINNNIINNNINNSIKNNIINDFHNSYDDDNNEIYNNNNNNNNNNNKNSRREILYIITDITRPLRISFILTCFLNILLGTAGYSFYRISPTIR